MIADFPLENHRKEFVGNVSHELRTFFSISQNISPLAKRTNCGSTKGTSKKSEMLADKTGLAEPDTNTIRFTFAPLWT